MSSTSAAEPIGIFGGTFDPVHLGHLRLAEEAIDILGLAGVRWIPAGLPALHQPPGASPQQRLEMVRLAIAGNARFELDAGEVVAERTSYTVPTLERLRSAGACGPERPLVLLVGADAFASLPDWHRWQDLFALAHIAVAHRPGCPVDASAWPSQLADAYRTRRASEADELRQSPAGRIITFAMTPLDISATRIRACLSGGKSIRYLLPDALIAYIRENNLYPEK